MSEQERTAALERESLADLHSKSIAYANRKAALERQRVTLENAIANALSTKPAAPDWWAHPGPLTVADVQSVTDFSTRQIAALMERRRRNR